jgi:hypothetical protein
MPTAPFQEAHLAAPIRDLGLTIEGTALAPVIAEFRRELAAAGIRRLAPRFYLSSEWGVPFGTVAIAIPFYLARPELTALHAERTGFTEGAGRAELLRYLRHEMGHVVNYAYRLYDTEEWVRAFGAITQPYVEEYRPEPFSRRFVRHLPGWYAQKHPDEDWAETFAVWMTPGEAWRAEYADWPVALAKLLYCDRTMAELGGREPLVQETPDSDLDEDVGGMSLSLDQFYRGLEHLEELPAGLDGALRTIFEDVDEVEAEAADARSHPTARPADVLIRGLARDLPAEVFRWTGHFPERTRALLEHLAGRAAALGQVYPAAHERRASSAVTVLVTALAANHVHKGSYLP